MIDSSVSLTMLVAWKLRARFSRRHRVVVAESGSSTPPRITVTPRIVSHSTTDKRRSSFTSLSPTNDPVHRASANDFPFQSRAARGSECNGLLSAVAVDDMTIPNLGVGHSPIRRAGVEQFGHHFRHIVFWIKVGYRIDDYVIRGVERIEVVVE